MNARWLAVNQKKAQSIERQLTCLVDLVQMQASPIGTTVDAIREALSWLGKCNREQVGHSMNLVFKFTPETDPQTTLKLKVKINTREHEHLLGIKYYPFGMKVSALLPRARF